MPSIGLDRAATLYCKLGTAIIGVIAPPLEQLSKLDYSTKKRALVPHGVGRDSSRRQLSGNVPIGVDSLFVGPEVVRLRANFPASDWRNYRKTTGGQEGLGQHHEARKGERGALQHRSIPTIVLVRG